MHSTSPHAAGHLRELAESSRNSVWPHHFFAALPQAIMLLTRDRPLQWYLAVLCAASCMHLSAGQATITTVAGNGTFAFTGDGGSATAAGLDSPLGVSAIFNPNSGGVVVYIADYASSRIRSVDEAGIITTVAGTGTAGFSGDGGAATAATLNYPYGVSVVFNASSGGMLTYIADTDNCRIRRVDEAGSITTIAGNGIGGYSGDGVAAKATALNSPFGVAAVYNASSGGVIVYIADTFSDRIRRVDEAGNISTVAGIGMAGFGGDGGAATAAMIARPHGLAAALNVSSGGIVLYIADTHNQRIRRVNEDGNISTVAGNGDLGYQGDGGAATAAKLYNAAGVSAIHNVSSGGEVLYIADSDNHRIRRVDEAG
ncbi:MAG: hypothetical protein EOO65_03340, partial [Methanosarcinales archaeon]